MDEKKAKDPVACLSSESEEEEEEDDYELDDEEMSSQSCSDEESDWNEEEADLESSEDDDGSDDDDKGGLKSTKVIDSEDSCNRVICLLKGGSDLQELKLVECKAYLRKHGLRLTGNKAVCIQRIKEHWRIEDGKGEELYPISSFIINCTGDVCTHDVVLFTQRVYERYDKVTRNGNHQGKRTIAGRVVKESYGAAKQQHTFTVEVLWSKGFKRLPPLFPLLVKGRNLYRYKTLRQCWDNEKERSMVLAEKHKRGAEARHLKAMKIARPANQGGKHRKQSYHAGPSYRRRNQEFVPSTKMERQKHIDSQGKASLLEQGKPKSVGREKISKSSLGNPKDKVHTFQAHSQNGQLKNFQFMGHENRAPSHVYNKKAGSASDAVRFAPFRDCTNQAHSQNGQLKNFQFMGHENRGPSHVYNKKAGSASDAMRLAPFRDCTNQAHSQNGQLNDFQFMGQEERGPSHVYNKACSASDAMRLAPFRDCTNQMLVPPTVSHQRYNQSNYGSHGYQFGARNLNCFVDQGGSLHQVYNQRNYGCVPYPDPAYQFGAMNINNSFVDEGGSLHPTSMKEAEINGGRRNGGVSMWRPKS
ncbi:uncharacterized protein LOC122074499 [Macadamia integrifolia]|uniref:uncharacterized protein LOC122074499 n=1 Tax=Macadamia integrifolia TaxID=60698 RepID=UPI001C4EF617|nr:uncharacterized protein LOC122074499 [Macadamia integrifolia]